MKVTCPHCNAMLTDAQLSVAANMATCWHCKEVSALSTLIGAPGVPADFDIHSPPPGAWFEEDDNGWVIGATMYSRGTLWGWIIFWLLIGAIVFAALTGQGGAANGRAPTVLGGLILFMSQVGLLIIVTTLAFGTVMSRLRRVTVRLYGDWCTGEITTGIGSVGRIRRFRWDTIEDIDLRRIPDNSDAPGPPRFEITLNGETTTKFGRGLTIAKRDYILNALRTLLQQKARGQRETNFSWDHTAALRATRETSK